MIKNIAKNILVHIVRIIKKMDIRLVVKIVNVRLTIVMDWYINYKNIARIICVKIVITKNM